MQSVVLWPEIQLDAREQELNGASRLVFLNGPLLQPSAQPRRPAAPSDSPVASRVPPSPPDVMQQATPTDLQDTSAVSRSPLDATSPDAESTPHQTVTATVRGGDSHGSWPAGLFIWLLAGLLLLAAGAGVTAWIAQSSFPGDTLYRVKLWTEQGTKSLCDHTASEGRVGTSDRSPAVG
jgi:hypothetical protein